MNESQVALAQSPLDFEALKERCLGNVDLVERVLKTFATQLDVDLAQLEQALAAGDSAGFALVAHRVKGMAANMAATGLSATAASAERSARDGLQGELPEHLARLRADRQGLVDALGSLRG
jgi:HPt (histidine-containing phosphotransfer) domain-containing protein